ncbi:MAG: CUB domain-containing protein, partial [Bacteroidota bacterium]
NAVTTICPSSPGQYITATFTSFNTESGFDPLTIYNGNSNTSPVIGTYSGTTLPSCINSTSTSGCLTFNFTSDGSVTFTGWEASITCTAAPSPCLPSCANLASPLNGATGACTNGLTLNWTAPPGGSAPSGYQLFLGTNNPPNNLLNGTNIGNVTSYNPGNLIPNTTYYWRVVPINAAGAATNCQVWTFTTGGSCIVQAPNASYTACSGFYYDSGGPTSNYGNSENSTTTICPSSPGQYVQLSFSALNLESCCDLLTIYSGSSSAGSLIGSFTGAQSPCAITSTATNGCLTMQFTSDGSINATGWVAAISCVASSSGPLPGSTCANAPMISLPFNASNQTTACYGNDYVNTTAGSCGTLYESGEDRVYAFTTATPQCLSVALTGASTSLIGYQIYSGCPGSGGICISSNGGSNSLSSSVSLPAAGTYYIIVDTWAPPSSATYNLSIAASGTSPSNDLPCNATSLPLGVNLSGSNACAGSISEPTPPTCWTSGTINSVWYRVVAPASGALRIRTTLGSNTNTQIGIYSGASCSALTLVACNANAPSCGSSSYLNSELAVTGLVANTTYFVVVDGENSITGSFDIMAIDGSQQFPPAAGQECITPNPVCDTTILIGDPGYQAFGNSCDFNGSGTCLISGERGSAWYTIPISANGVLQFNIVPNNWAGAPSTTATDYDFAIWRVPAGSTITSTCVTIAGGTVPVACNYSALGVTGLYGTLGNAPPAYPGFDFAYEPQINVFAGETYLLVISNFSNSTSGFTLNFDATAPINYTSPSVGSVVWTGGTNTQWGLQSNWGGCAAPVCGVNATIGPSSVNQPVLAPGTYNVNNLTINPGATLTLLAGSVLQVCGNFSNAGSLVANPGATIEFVGTALLQTISGALVGPDKFPSLVVNKLLGTVFLNNDIDIGGSFTTTNSTTTFNSNNRYVKIAGDFLNSSGDTTYQNPSTLEFNGSTLQNYNQGTPPAQLNLNTVLMNHTGPGVNLLSNLCMRATTGQLNLTLGKIVTNAFEVRQLNSAPASVTVGNVSSYVEGNLRRKLLPPGSVGIYDFPVGHASKGYQRANINFSGNLNIDNLLAFFTPYSTVPPGLMVTDCSRYFNFNALDNGKWVIDAYSNSFTRIAGTANYIMTLFNRNFTNSGSCTAWTIMKDSIGLNNWYLNGICDPASVPGSVRRTGMTGFSHFGTAQGGITLPVELIKFDGHNDKDHNVLQWTTASEINNDHFTVTRSSDGIHFEDIGTVQGAGNSTITRNYELLDKQPLPGINYYRLRQTDYDGMEELSDIIAIKVNSKDFSIVSVRPNPNGGRFFLDFYSDMDGQGQIIVSDLTGRELFSNKIDYSSGTNTFPVDMDAFSKGIYSVRILSGSDGRSSTPTLVVLQK